MKRSVFSYPYIVWMVIFILSPMLLIVYYAFSSGGALTFANIRDALLSEIYMPVLLRSVIVALEATAICIALGYPIAYLLSNMKKEHGLACIGAFYRADVDELSASHVCLAGDP